MGMAVQPATEPGLAKLGATHGGVGVLNDFSFDLHGSSPQISKVYENRQLRLKQRLNSGSIVDRLMVLKPIRVEPA